MPALHPQQLIDAIIDAVCESGSSAVLLSAIRAHPRRLAVANTDGTDVQLWAYAWTLTHGGTPRSPDEYRIQMTGVKPPLRFNPDGPTVLIGYEPSLQMFAGFDIQQHQMFSTKSPSIQINIAALQAGLQDGLAFARKANDEIAVGVRPDQFMTYALAADALHRYGSEANVLNFLHQAAAGTSIPETELESMTGERRRVIQTVSRASRLGSFRQQVLNAYEHRCAVTRAQLRLVDAAHILPVKAPGSVDDVRNGLALSPTYHRAYDLGLIYLDDSWVMRINPDRERDLKTLRLDAGLFDFVRTLGRIHLPHDRHQWPDAGMIRRANLYRRIQPA